MDINIEERAAQAPDHILHSHSSAGWARWAVPPCRPQGRWLPRDELLRTTEASSNGAGMSHAVCACVCVHAGAFAWVCDICPPPVSANLGAAAAYGERERGTEGAGAGAVEE